MTPYKSRLCAAQPTIRLRDSRGDCQIWRIYSVISHDEKFRVQISIWRLAFEPHIYNIEAHERHSARASRMESIEIDML